MLPEYIYRAFVTGRYASLDTYNLQLTWYFRNVLLYSFSSFMPLDSCSLKKIQFFKKKLDTYWPWSCRQLMMVQTMVLASQKYAIKIQALGRGEMASKNRNWRKSVILLKWVHANTACGTTHIPARIDIKHRANRYRVVWASFPGDESGSAEACPRFSWATSFLEKQVH